MENSNRKARVHVTVELIEHLLNAGIGNEDYIVEPAHGLSDIHILRVSDIDIQKSGYISAIITSPDLPEVEIGALIPERELHFKQIQREECK